MFIKVREAFVFGLQTLEMKDFCKINEVKGLKPKNKGYTNFYEYCDLTEKVYLIIFVAELSKFRILLITSQQANKAARRQAQLALT